MKNKNLVESFNNAIAGLVYTIKAERNMKIHIIASVLVVVCSIVYGVTKLEFLIVCTAVILVIVSELLNTVIEVLVDTIIGVYHPKAKIAKDVAAAAVFVSTVFSLIVAYLIFYHRIIASLSTGIIKVKQTPMQITIIAIIVTIVLVFVIKLIFKKGTPFSGGMPSGHAAVSVAVFTAIALWVDNLDVTFLVLIIVLLVIQSRLEGKIHTILESLVGAVLGFAITLLLFQILK